MAHHLGISVGSFVSSGQKLWLKSFWSCLDHFGWQILNIKSTSPIYPHHSFCLHPTDQISQTVIIHTFGHLKQLSLYFCMWYSRKKDYWYIRQIQVRVTLFLDQTIKKQHPYIFLYNRLIVHLTSFASNMSEWVFFLLSNALVIFQGLVNHIAKVTTFNHNPLTSNQQ